MSFVLNCQLGGTRLIEMGRHSVSNDKKRKANHASYRAQYCKGRTNQYSRSSRHAVIVTRKNPGDVGCILSRGQLKSATEDLLSRCSAVRQDDQGHAISPRHSQRRSKAITRVIQRHRHPDERSFLGARLEGWCSAQCVRPSFEARKSSHLRMTSKIASQPLRVTTIITPPPPHAPSSAVPARSAPARRSGRCRGRICRRAW